MVYRTLLNPQIDFVFKKIFGTEKNKPMIIIFIQTMKLISITILQKLMTIL